MELAELLPDATAKEFVESRFSYDEFLSILSRLPNQCASLLRKLVLYGRKPQEVAFEEGVSVSAVRTRLHRAKKAFAKVRADLEVML
jgi:DNA-directed RNA polymerase specialized sigma24 family protein